MLGANRRRLGARRGLLVAAVVGVLAAGIIACTATTAHRSATSEPDRIADVRVEHEEEATRVTLVGLDHPVFTAFLQENPERIVIDLASVEPAHLMDPIPVYDGLVEEVSVSPFSTGTGDSMTRVEISLSGPADYELEPTEEGLEIALAFAAAPDPLAELHAGRIADEAPPEEDPWAISPLGEEEQAAAAEPLEWHAPPATVLQRVEASGTDTGEGSLIHLRADGTVTSAVSFTLEDPQRLVIDLPGMSTEVAQRRIQIDSPHAARVRVGKHSDMVRVVIDGGPAPDPFAVRRVVPAPDGLLVAIGSGEAVERAVAAVGRMASGTAAGDLGLAEAIEDLRAEEEAAPEAGANGGAASDWSASGDAGWEPLAGEAGAPKAQADAWEAEVPLAADAAGAAKPAAAPEPRVSPAAGRASAPVTIYGVDFDAQQARDRIVVLGEAPVDYLVYEPDPETVVLSIEGAVIDPEAAVRIAPDPGGPVSLVTSFDQPDVATPEVRVVVKRAPNLKPQVSRKGSLLVMDFPRTGVPAATPPVLAQKAAALEHAGGQVLGTSPAAVAYAAASGQAASASRAVPASLEPPAAIGILREGGLFEGKDYTGRRISLDFKDVEIGDVLRLIAEVSDLNVIAGDEVKGRVTIRLVDVPWDQALDVILLTKSLGFVRVGNVLRIAPADVLKQEEELRLQERRALEKLEDLVVKLQPVNYADVKDIENMVKRLLSPRGSVNTDKRTNTLIIKDIPSVVDEATALVKAIDTQTPQVMIEAKIVEASLDFSREFGNNWAVGAQPLVDGFDPSSATRRDLGPPGMKFHNSDGSSFFGNNAVFSNPITAGPTALFNIATFLLDEKLNLELQLQAAEVSGDGKVISSPRIVTLDNSQATIEQGVSIPFQTFENGDAQLEFVDAVLKLKVTPHITADQSIIMEIEVSRNAPDDSVFTLTGSPAIAKNQVKTETLVRDGQTLVLGGIYVVDKSARQSRVPYLHKIPLLGSAFRSDEISDARKELLIFVAPKVVQPQQVAS